jgi:hypothetical protein
MRLQVYGHGVAGLFADCLAHIRSHGQHVPTITHSHERTSERMAVYRACNLHESPGFEECD